ncbi:MAG: threonyl/alanyl tRNA synthetase SAD protein [Comamonadaceae bacterium]|nr:MAG: threonyl/alanyl tRNA synthetase SAD protein [Comamonadaceae bacterium]
MTEQLYFSSDQLSINATVLACVSALDHYEITLDRTVFHPQGGGQASDVGHIGDLRVSKVVQKKGALVHCVNTPLTLGEVTLQVDSSARLLHSRLHTAGHLIGHVLAPLGYIATRAHHWPGEARVYVSPTPDSANACLSVADLQKRLDELIALDLPRVTKMHEAHREIGFGELPAYPCGGTHVASTGEVGRCIIEDIGESENGLRIRYTVV